MKNRTPLILGGIFLVLVIVFLATSINPPERTKGATPLFKGEKPDIDKLEIVSPTNGRIVVEKQDGIWNITAPVNYRASDASVEVTINTLRDLVVDGVVSSRVESQEKFEVSDDLGAKLKAFSGGDLVLDAIVGKQAVDMSHTYARLAGNNDIYLWRGMVKSHVDRDPSDWRDKTIYSFNDSDIMSISSSSGRTTKTLTLDNNLWVYKENGAEKPVEQQNVKDLVTLIATLRCDAFADERDIPRVASSNPDTRVTFTVRNGDSHTFDIWTPGDQDAGRYLIRKENGDEVFRFYRYRGEQLGVIYDRLKPAGEEG